jgi:hypothetical protein
MAETWGGALDFLRPPFVLGVPGIWGLVPWSKAGSDQLLKSYKKGDLYGGPIFFHIFQMEPSYAWSWE